MCYRTAACVAAVGDCKGKGWIAMSAEDCKAKGGTVKWAGAEGF